MKTFDQTTDSQIDELETEYDGEDYDTGDYYRFGRNSVKESLTAVVQEASALREAQKAYMADRGNEVKGKAVAKAAEKLDKALELVKSNGDWPLF